MTNDTTNRLDFARAKGIITKTERELGELTDTQRRNLLASRTDWNADRIAAVVGALNVINSL